MKKAVWSLLSLSLFFLYTYFFPDHVGLVGPATKRADTAQTKQAAVVREGVSVPDIKTTETTTTETDLYTVTRVVDGDTIEVERGGVREKVRLVGINTPELRDKRQLVHCFAEAAKAKTAELVAGREVRLEDDPTQDDRDKYHRLLRYVYVGDVLVNRELVAQGFAYEYTYRVPYQYQKEFRSLQTRAREAQTGLWSDTCLHT